MRTITLAVAGLVAVANALPTGVDSIQLRQEFTEPVTTILIPGGSPAVPKKEFKIPPIPFPIPGEESPSFKIGGRSLSHIDDLAAAFVALAKKYEHKAPPLSTYLILEHMAALLAAAGKPTKDIIFLGPVETHFQISTKEKRQGGVFGIGGGCNVDDLVSLLLTYSSLQAIYGSNPPTQIKILKEAIAAALRYCNMDPDVGGIIPDRPTPGAPMVPERPVPGAPMTPDKPATGAPLTPDKPVIGAPLTPEKPAPGAPMVPSS